MHNKPIPIIRAESVCSRPGSPVTSGEALFLAEEIIAKFNAMPDDTRLYFATTVGAVELLERGECDDTSERLFRKIAAAWDFSGAVMVSAACAGGQQAVSLAVRAIRAGRCRNALVVAIDGESEFVTSGFASLGAVSASSMRPYDANRDGLKLGGGAGAILLGSDAASDEALAWIAGIGSSCDAAHITAPDPEGLHLSRAIAAALEDAGITADGVGGVIGHGTGTVHNDAAEIAALNSVFENSSPPLVSIKAFTGHTLAATGAIQLVFAAEYLQRGEMPGQYGLQTPMPGAERFVSAAERRLLSPFILSINAGFGGINSAIVVKGGGL